MLRRTAVAVAVAGIATVSWPAVASLVRAMDLDELTTSSDRIVVADVSTVHAAWDDAHRSIVSTVEIDVRETWKGAATAGERLSIRQPGGTVGDIEMTVHGMPRFSVGERALLFLHSSHVVGMSQGKRNLRWEATDRRWLVEAAERSEVVRVDAAGKLHSAGPGQSEDLDSLRKRVLGLVRR